MYIFSATWVGDLPVGDGVSFGAEIDGDPDNGEA